MYVYIMNKHISSQAKSKMLPTLTTGRTSVCFADTGRAQNLTQEHRKGTNGVSTNEAAANFVVCLTEGPFGYSR